MPIKNLLNRFQPAPLYIVLILSICYFSVQLILSHLTHALTLLMASYHMLCNIFALAGSIVTIKHNELHNENERYNSEMDLKRSMMRLADDANKQVVAVGAGQKAEKQTVSTSVQVSEEEIRLTQRKRRELKTRNTFGWARIEILTMLIVCITLASLSFSLLVEALQTLVHIDHQDSMHLPVHVMILGVVGLLLNGFTYLLIGGYTLHQGNFLHINPTGKVVVEPSNITVETNALPMVEANNDRQLKEELQQELGKVHYHTRREGAAELLRDVSSTLFVIVCAVIVYFSKDKEHTAKFIDPVLSIFSCVLVVALSYPYMKEACMILLQTIPGSLDMENFERNLVTKFPEIVSYHDLHIWQLSSHSYIATIHIIFKSPKLYAKTIDDVRAHFKEHSIANVTIQPEFEVEKIETIGALNNISMECLMSCQHPDCADKVCCKDSLTDLREISVCPGGEQQHEKKSAKKHHHHHGHGHGHSHGNGHGHGHSHKVESKYKNHGHDHGKGGKCKANDKVVVPNCGGVIITEITDLPTNPKTKEVPIENRREVENKNEMETVALKSSQESKAAPRAMENLESTSSDAVEQTTEGTTTKTEATNKEPQTEETTATSTSKDNVEISNDNTKC